MPALAGSAPVCEDVFHTTRWSLVQEAGAGASPAAREALEQLCRIYWPAIYAYLRRRGYPLDDAKDLTQSFFQELLENETLTRASRARGRFRSFLLGALQLCLSDEHARKATAKRGGTVQFISLQQLEDEESYEQRMAVQGIPADEMLDARWAGLLLERALSQLRSEMGMENKKEVFETLSPFLANTTPGLSYEGAASTLRVGVGAVKSMICRIRRRFAEILRREIIQTVSAPHEVDDELRRLRDVFARALRQRN